MSSLSLACTLKDKPDQVKEMNKKVFKTIQTYGPNPNHTDMFSRSPLHHAAKACNETAVEHLLKHGLDFTKDDGTVVSPQIKINVNAKTIGGETPLMKAAEAGSMDICVLLLRAGANPLLQDNGGRTAARFAQLNHPDKEIHNMLNNYCANFL